MKLVSYANNEYEVGAPFYKQLLWYFFGSPLLASGWFVSSSLRTSLLRLFGCSMGKGVVIKPHVQIKFPWKLTIGDYSWIGEHVWLDTVAPISIGSNVCISQGAFLTSGSHNWQEADFRLIQSPIVIEDSVWIAAKVNVAPGCHIKSGAVVTMGSTVAGEVDSNAIYTGVPAKKIRDRYKAE